MKPAKFISLADYAKHVGTSAQVVTRAIESGRIPASAVTQTGAPGLGGTGVRVFINQTEADPAWIATFNEASGNPTWAARAAVERIQKELEAETSAPEGSDMSEIAASPALPAQTDHSDEKKMTLSEAKRREAEAKAVKLQMEVLEKKGSLIQKDVVYRQLFGVGRQLRDNIMGVPVIAAPLIAAKTGGNHTEIQNILTEMLVSLLENLDNLENVKLG